MIGDLGGKPGNDLLLHRDADAPVRRSHAPSM
jgi:hypothetical protein